VCGEQGLTIIITMAGLGTRFREAGYREEKHEIVFHGRTLFEWALESLRNFFRFDFVFITRDLPGIREFIVSKSGKLGLRPEKIQIKAIRETTRGQAETALLAGELLDPSAPVLIHNIDTHISPDCLRPESIRGNGWIPVFPADGDRWSFVEADSEGLVSRTSEKVRISDHCSVGLYYFDSFEKFAELAGDLEGSAREWYIAPLYNDFIRRGNKVYLHEIPAEGVMVLGTPEDLGRADERKTRFTAYPA